MPLAARLLAACLLAGLPFAAQAESPTEAAQALQAQIRAWIAGLAGPGVDFGSRQVTVSPDGDAYRFELPIAGPVDGSGWHIAGDPVTARVRPLDAGRWAIESLRLPSPVEAAGPSKTGHGALRWSLQLAEQDFHGVFDPNLASASSFDAMLRGYTSTTRTPEGSQTTHFDRYTVHGALEPAGDGRVTLSAEGGGENLSMETVLPKSPGRIIVTAAEVRGNIRMERVAFDRIGGIARALGAMAPAAASAAANGGKPDKLTPATRESMRAIVTAMRDLVGGLEEDVSVRNLTFDAGAASGSIERFEFSLGGKARDGMGDATARIAVEGIDSPLLPPGPLRDYLPRRVVVVPHLGGLPTDAIFDALLRSIDSGDMQNFRQQLITMLGKGPVKFGLDDFSIELATASLKASGAVTVAALTDITASAHVAVTGLDGLIRQANTVPELRSVAPVLVFAKGLGEQKGDVTSWTIAYEGGRATVNGTDMSALMGGDGAQRPPSGQRPRRPPTQRP